MRQAVAKHFVAVSTNAEEVAEFGIDTANMFEFWDWVGGRYSMDSAIGLSTMIAIGPDNFRAMLAGFHEMDEHFRTAPFEQNLPVLMGLLASGTTIFLVRNGGGAALRAISQTLPGLSPAVDDGEQRKTRHARRRDGRLRHRPHLLGRARHQRPALLLSIDPPGDELIPCDFIGFAQTLNPLGRPSRYLLANVFAQAEALAFGKTAEEVKAEGTPDWLVPHRVFEGNRPSNTIFAERLTPEILGKLVALYEHMVFTQGIIWQSTRSTNGAWN